MSMCESILTIALVCTVKYLHYCDYYYTLGNDSQSTPKLIAYKASLSGLFFLFGIVSSIFPIFVTQNQGKCMLSLIIVCLPL